MINPAKSFVIAAAVLALVALRLKLSLTPIGMDFQIHDTYFVFSPIIAFSGMAIVLGLFAAIYAFVPGIGHGGVWHFWLTAIGIVLFWWGFFLFSKYRPSGDLSGLALVIAIAWLASFPLILIVQGIFLLNLVSGLMKLRT